jgi:L-rhamnose mutarotase
MKGNILSVLLAGAAALAISLASAHFGGAQQAQPTRTGMIIGIKPDRISAYEALHAASNPGVRDLLDKYHIHNFSIFIRKMDEDHYLLFAYYEYTGNDRKADTEKMAAEPRNQKWLSVTGPMQIPLGGDPSWSKMEEIYHNP